MIRIASRSSLILRFLIPLSQRLPAACVALLVPCFLLQATLPFAIYGQSEASPGDGAAMESAAPHPVQTMKAGHLQGDERLLLVLDRFTYGPRPGDLDRLRTMGIQTWFNQQLNPEKIDDSALDARLRDYPAMQLSLREMMERYPNAQMIRRVIGGKEGRPGGEAERAIYADQIARYEARRKNAGNADPNSPAVPAQDKPNNPAADQNGGGDPAMDGQPLPAGLPFDTQALLDLPAEKRFSALCKMPPAQQSALRQSLRPQDRGRLIEGFTPEQLEVLAALRTPAGVIGAEVQQTKLLRDLYSERQLNEIMTDFWLNHFNVYLKKSQDAPYYIATYERDAIRPHALGSFESLLIAAAGSPAMLNYLDNASSIGPHSLSAERANDRGPQKKSTGLNENYARELMELHTVGVNGGYTQKDVTEVAKVFTGWTVGAGFQRGGVPYQPQFDPLKHEPGSKIVMGTTIKENGEGEGLEVLQLLASSPKTAQFISTKLAVRFVSDNPPQAMVDRMARTFLSSHGDIRQVLLTMVNSPEFFTTETYRAKIKTPQDFVLSAVRASGAEVQSAGALVNVIAELGMPLYGMQTPNGYSMKAEPWNSTSSLVSRLNFALALSSNRVQGVTANWTPILGDPPAKISSTKLDEIFEARLLHLAVSPRTRQAILAQLNADPEQQVASLHQVVAADRKRDPLLLRVADAAPKKVGEDAAPLEVQSALAAGLIFGSPEFQRR